MNVYDTLSTLFSFLVSPARLLQSFSKTRRRGQGMHESTSPCIFLTRASISRLREYKDTVGLIVFTLDLVTHNCPTITTVENLPYDSLFLVPCPAALGGVIIVTSNSLVHVSQIGRRTVLPVNGWLSRVSDATFTALSSDALQRDLKLEGACATFVEEKTLYLVLKDGTVYPVEIVAEGRTVSELSIAAPVAQTTIPSVVRCIPSEHVFIGSMVGPSVLLKTNKVEVELREEDVEMNTAPASVVDNPDTMDFDDDDGALRIVQLFLVLILILHRPLRHLEVRGCRDQRGDQWCKCVGQKEDCHTPIDM